MAEPPKDDEALKAEQRGWMTQIAAGGDAGQLAMHKLFVGYDRPTVLRLMRDFSLSQAEAEDIWMDVLAKLPSKAHLFPADAILAAWLKKVVDNQALDALRSGWRRLRGSLGNPGGSEEDDEQTDPFDALPDLARPDEPHRLAADACADDALKRFALQHPQEARWLRDRDLEGRDVASLAAELGRSQDATRQYLSSLRRKLKPYLEDCVDLLRND